MSFEQINGTQLYYEVSGHGKPLLFLHGLGSSSADWAYQRTEFERNYQVITLDFRGHGQSDQLLAPIQISQFAQDVSVLLERLGLPSVQVVGLSLGGIVAIQMAVDSPSMIQKLVLVNSFVELPFSTIKDKLELYKRLLVVNLLGMRKMGQILSKRLFPNPQDQALRESFIDKWGKNDKHSYINCFKSLIGWTVKSQLPTINLPILVIGSEHDYTSTQDKKEIVDALPNAQLVIIDSTHHAVPVEAPDRFNAVLTNFLSSVDL